MAGAGCKVGGGNKKCVHEGLACMVNIQASTYIYFKAIVERGERGNYQASYHLD